VRKRYAFINGDFPLVDRDSLNTETVEVEEDDKEKLKNDEIYAVFASMMEENETEKDEDAFQNEFSHCIFEDISGDDETKKVFFFFPFACFHFSYLFVRIQMSQLLEKKKPRML
jgi:hypothetical protein